MKMLAAVLIALVLASPAVLAVSKSYQALYPQTFNVTRPTTPSTPKTFTGLRGIIGTSIEEPEHQYGPQKPFGKPKPKRLKEEARVPPGYHGLGGIAGPGPGATTSPCARFDCKPGQNVIGDTSTKRYYRCYCGAAQAIAKENRKCIDTPAIAQRIGFTEGTC